MKLLTARRAWFLVSGILAALLVFSAVDWLPSSAPPRALAQGEGEAKADDPNPPANKSDEGPHDKDESVLSFYFRSLGWFYTITFLAISFTLVALVVMNFLTLRRSAVVPLTLIEGFESNLNEKKYQEAFELAKTSDSFLGRVLAAGLAKLGQGYPQAIEAMQEVGEEESMKLEHRLSYVALIGAISPMVGLLGTVDGMVASFRVIASSPTTPKPYELAEGISTALITTLVGLWLAIPAILIFGHFKNVLARLVLEVGVLSEGLMSRFQSIPQKKA